MPNTTWTLSECSHCIRSYGSCPHSIDPLDQMSSYCPFRSFPRIALCCERHQAAAPETEPAAIEWWERHNFLTVTQLMAYYPRPPKKSNRGHSRPTFLINIISPLQFRAVTEISYDLQGQGHFQSHCTAIWWIKHRSACCKNSVMLQ